MRGRAKHEAKINTERGEMYIVFKASIGDLNGPFYLTHASKSMWTSYLDVLGGETAIFESFEEAADIADRHGALVSEV